MSVPLLSIRDLRVDLDTLRGLVHAVRGVSFEVGAGEVMGLVGESGCGKSMTAMSLANLLPVGARMRTEAFRIGTRDLSGTVGDEVWRAVRREDIGFVFQNPMTALNPQLTIGDQLAEALAPVTARSARTAAAVRLLERVGIPNAALRLGQYPHELSGGLAQRVVIALALSRGPKLLVADEPTTALDVSVQAQILDLVAGLRAELGMAMLLVSHDLHVIAARTDRISVMYAGRIVETGPTATVLRAPAHPYTRGLLAATPQRGVANRVRLVSLDGRPPLLFDPPKGCAFAPRCFAASAACRTADAALASFQGRLVACHNLAAAAAKRPEPALFAPRINIRPAAAPLLSARAVTKTYGRGRATRQVMGPVDLEIRPGESVGVIGESGSGKTTLARIMMGLTPATSGAVICDGRPLETLRGRDLVAWRRRVQFVFQDSSSALDPRMTIGQSILQSAALLNLDHRAARARVAQVLEEVGLDASFGERRPHELSGGQRQRVGFARALIVDPELIIADEPVSALDVSVQAVVLNLMNHLRDTRGIGMMMISHDLGVIGYVCERVAVMQRGQIVETGPTDQILSAPQTAYTQLLIASVPGGLAEGQAAAGLPASAEPARPDRSAPAKEPIR